MLKRIAAMTTLGIAFMAQPSLADELSVHDAHHRISPYPSRWCIEDFLARNRSNRPMRLRNVSYPAPTTGFSDAAVIGTVSNEPSRWSNTLIGRIIEQRSLRLATLWTGRDSALYFGLDDHGTLGVSLGERVPPDRR